VFNAAIKEGVIHEGLIAGGQIGYNWQIDRFVEGVEADLQWTDMNGQDDRSGQTGFAFLTDERHSWFGTARGRSGITFDRVLLYLSAGLAYGHISSDVYMSQGGAWTAASGSFTKVGWTAAAGVEFAIADKWSTKAEVLWYDLGNISVGQPSVGGKTFNTATAIYRIGADYHFDWARPIAAKY
jgi:outer membrane immunogenic protein